MYQNFKQREAFAPYANERDHLNVLLGAYKESSSNEMNIIESANFDIRKNKNRLLMKPIEQ